MNLRAKRFYRRGPRVYFREMDMITIKAYTVPSSETQGGCSVNKGIHSSVFFENSATPLTWIWILELSGN